MDNANEAAKKQQYMPLGIFEKPMKQGIDRGITIKSFTEDCGDSAN